LVAEAQLALFSGGWLNFIFLGFFCRGGGVLGWVAPPPRVEKIQNISAFLRVLSKKEREFFYLLQIWLSF